MLKKYFCLQFLTQLSIASGNTLLIDLKEMLAPNYCTSDKPCSFTVVERKAHAISYVTTTETNLMTSSDQLQY